MDYIEVIYIVSSVIQLIAGLPQAFKIYRKKSAHDVSVTTWFAWGVTQLIALIYQAHREEWVMVCMSILWITVDVLVVWLALYYRYLYHKKIHKN